MKLTKKDKQFLETLRLLMESQELQVELSPGRPSRVVLRGNYGDKIHRAFRMSRQGVRWRFQRLLGDVYVSAFETILLVERTLGTQVRDHAVRISRERYELRRQIRQTDLERFDSPVHRRETHKSAPDRRVP